MGVFLNLKPRFFFTVVIPSYNRSRMLEAALRSVLRQTCSDFECWVVDDGSSDDTPSVFKKFAGQENFRWHRFPQNRGQYACRNYAIRRAWGRFITFLDSDDVWLPARLEEFQKAAQAGPQVGFWFSNAYVWREGRVIGTIFNPSRPIPGGEVPGYYAVGDRYLPYVTTNVAVSREAIEKTGLFREDMRVLEDTELYARILKNGFWVGTIRKPLAVRRIHGQQITRDHEMDFRESLIALRSGGASGEIERLCREDLAYRTAGYMLKGLEPGRSVRFLREVGIRKGVRYWSFCLLALVPVWVLRGLLKIRRSVISRPIGLRRPRDLAEAEDLMRSL